MTAMMCFQRIVSVGCPLSVRCGAGVCGLQSGSWRPSFTPVSKYLRVKVPHVRLKGTDSRAVCWDRVVHQVKPGFWKEPQTVFLYRGGHYGCAVTQRSTASPEVRGLCCENRKGTVGSSKEPERTEDGTVPGHGLFKFKELHENPWTIPNLLCVSRILLAPLLGYLVVQQHFHMSLALFTLAGATDLLDGYIARTWPNQKSALGSALDPLADKILVSILYVSLTYADLIPAPLTALVIFRDIGLIAAVFWIRYKTVPPPVTLAKFFNPCYTTAQLKPTLFSKVNTAIQLLLVAVSLAAPVFQFTDSVLLPCIWYVTAVTTAASGYSYWHYGRKTVKVLNTRSQ